MFGCGYWCYNVIKYKIITVLVEQEMYKVVVYSIDCEIRQDIYVYVVISMLMYMSIHFP